MPSLHRAIRVKVVQASMMAPNSDRCSKLSQSHSLNLTPQSANQTSMNVSIKRIAKHILQQRAIFRVEQASSTNSDGIALEQRPPNILAECTASPAPMAAILPQDGAFNMDDTPLEESKPVVARKRQRRQTRPGAENGSLDKPSGACADAAMLSNSSASDEWSNVEEDPDEVELPEDDEDELLLDDVGEDHKIRVHFDFSRPQDSDYSAIKQLLMDMLSAEKTELNLSGLAGAIAAEPPVGWVIKCRDAENEESDHQDTDADDAVGFFSILDINEVYQVCKICGLVGS